MPSRRFVCFANDGAEGLRSPPDREPGPLQPLPDTGTPGVIAAAGEGPGPSEECICRSVTVTHYLYTHDGRLLREYVNGVGQRDFIHAGPESESGIGGKKIAVYEHGGSWQGKLHYFLTDHHGSTRVMVDSTGAVKSWFDYHPYGTLRASQVTTVDTKHRYTGKEHDSDDILNQDYFGARYLHGNTLRFTAVDPQASRYAGWSPYCYALADPMRLVDPDGEFVVFAAGVLLAAAAYTALTPDVANAPATPESPTEPARTNKDELQDAAVTLAVGLATFGISYATQAAVRSIVGRITGRAASSAANAASDAAASASRAAPIRNAKLAGSVHPKTGIPFDKNGFPDFSKVSIKTVRIQQTGQRVADRAAANRAAGIKSEPPGYTWHHHQDGRTMQLVPTQTHVATGHTGGVALGGGGK